MSAGASPLSARRRGGGARIVPSYRTVYRQDPTIDSSIVQILAGLPLREQCRPCLYDWLYARYSCTSTEYGCHQAAVS